MHWEAEKEKFYEFIIENKVIGFYKKPVLLKSGRESPFYVNWRNISEDVYLTDKLTDYLLSYIKHLQLVPDCFFGVPEGATKLGIITQFKWARKNRNYKPGTFTLSMGRGKPKSHGELKDRFYLGLPKGKVVILEDVTTTGGSLIQCIEELQNIGINVISAIGLTNRNEIRDDGKTVEQLISEKGVKYFAMSNIIEILPMLNPNKEIASSIENYFKKFGIKPIKL
ncbi:MAG: orotate phosphoribosyltransferase [Promethearchaeota archaeon]